MARPAPLKTSLSLPPHILSSDLSPGIGDNKIIPAEQPSKKGPAEQIDRVSSEPIGNGEKEAAAMRLRRSSDVFDLDLVKRRDRRPKTSVYMMEQKGRDRVRKAVLNVLLFPLHLSWWRKRVPTARPYLYRFSILYILHGISLLRELFRGPSETPVEFVELMLPFLLLIVTSILMGQAAASAIAPSRSADPASSDSPPVPTTSISNGEPLEASPAKSEASSTLRQGKPRKIRRKISKADANNDSTSEMFNDDDDEERTASSAESETSDTPSDSSGDDEKNLRRKPSVAVRRSSLLGVLNPPGGTSSTNHGLNPSQEYATGGKSSPLANINGHSHVSPRTLGITMPATTGRQMGSSPTHGALSQLRNNQRKPRFGWPRLSRHNTEPAAHPKELIIAPADEEDAVDSDTEEEDENAHEQYEAKVQHGNFGVSNVEQPTSSLSRTRFFSHSMDDLLESVKSVHWSAHGPEKVSLTPGQIRSELERKIFEVRMSETYRHLAFAGAVVVSSLPVIFRAWFFGGALYCQIMELELSSLLFEQPASCSVPCTVRSDFLDDAIPFFSKVFGTSIMDLCGVLTSAVSNFALTWILLGHVSGAVETFKRRYLYAKYFSKLTSSRKARRAGLPYFRLHKVDHIKVWLSLRSRRTDMDRESIGPYRASDAVTHFLFMVAIFLVGVVAIRAMQNLSGGVKAAGPAIMMSTLSDWLLLAWASILAIYVQRIVALAQKTHDRFQNTSVLLTEELNIHMRLLRKPEKKDELNACNQMLKVASALIKELEGGKNKKTYGGAFMLDPWLYSIVRVVLLSALGALSSDLFGFRVRLWKI